MNNYISLARKYRPTTFMDVVGQENIIALLIDEVINNKIGHAYLFYGARGTGKTSTARILARTINCQRIDQKTCTPCGVCDVCNNSAMTFFEMDAASNNSVEDIRKLTEEARLPSPFAKYKIFIIDEVHMLSSAAFNAFLKTLEEPQERVVFILATTEFNKVPATITSRCQVFHFKLIEEQIISTQLIKILDNEGIKYELEALKLIARQAGGAMRDALSLLDALVGDAQTLTVGKVKQILNIVDDDVYVCLCEYIINKDKKNVISLFEKMYFEGIDCLYFLNGLLNFFMNFFYVKQGIKLGEKKYDTLITSLCLETIEKILKLVNDAIVTYKDSINKKLYTEITLLQIIDLVE